MINQVLIIGTLGGAPEIRETTNGTKVASFSVATTERWKDKSGQQQESTEWHKIVAWDRLAEICGQYLQKGSKVYIEGRLKTRKWTDQNGLDKYITEIIASEMKMLGGRNDNIIDAPRSERLENVTSAPKKQSEGEAEHLTWSSTGDDVPF
jgi:single-strand DNA-binding protein